MFKIVRLENWKHVWFLSTFEILNNSLGAQNALCGGGRYDKLIERLGGKSTPAVGFAVGIERILLAMNQQNEQKNTNNYFSRHSIGITNF